MKGEAPTKNICLIFRPVIQEIQTRTIKFARYVQIIGMKFP